MDVQYMPGTPLEQEIYVILTPLLLLGILGTYFIFRK
jgi:hypothetical protein